MYEVLKFQFHYMRRKSGFMILHILCHILSQGPLSHLQRSIALAWAKASGASLRLFPSNHQRRVVAARSSFFLTSGMIP